MKILVNIYLFIAVLLIGVLALPFDQPQTPLLPANSPKKVDGSVKVSLESQRGPLVVKVNHKPKTPSTKAVKLVKTSKPSKAKSWTFSGLLGSKKNDEASLSCFCATSTICCQTAEGLQCNYGVCGI
jgi:hypothetical protein